MRNIILACLMLCATVVLADIASVNVSTTEVEIMPSKVNVRNWWVIQNQGTNDVYVKFDSSTNSVTTVNGFKLVAGASMTFYGSAGGSATQNRMTAISASGTNSVTYQEGSQR